MKRSFIVVLTFIFLIGCNKENETVTTKYDIKGLFQKGPFLKGTSVSISELNNDLSQTGKSFNAIILDDKGSFEISNLELTSKYVYITADGYFYNEVEDALSNSTIALSAIVDVESNASINVNIITTLETERVKYLVENGSSFLDAKAQARDEIYGIFGFSSSNSDNPETFDITETGNNNSILLAISVIILGTHTEAELTEMISGIFLDIKTDGMLDDTELQSALINEATLLDINAVKTNLKNKYSDLGENIVINEFDLYVDSFVNTTNYVFTKSIAYPTLANSLLNVISDTSVIWTGGVKYCIAADLPKGTSLTVIFKPTPGYTYSGIGISSMENDGWTINSMRADSTNLQANGTGQIVTVPFQFGPPTSIDFFIYENNSVIPTVTKTIQ